jgi:hypothetical protein
VSICQQNVHESERKRLIFRDCAPGVTRTPDRRIRNPLLYPAELRAQNVQYLASAERKIQCECGES